MRASKCARGLTPLHSLLSAYRAVPQHRDIKPSNILLNEALVAQLGDTGLAKVQRSSSGASTRGTTTHGGTPGTPGFIDPLLSDAGTPDFFLADGFGMGKTLLMALTGQPPPPPDPSRCGAPSPHARALTCA